MNDTDDPDTDIAIEIRRKEACRTAIEHGPDTADATEHPAPA